MQSHVGRRLRFLLRVLCTHARHSLRTSARAQLSLTLAPRRSLTSSAPVRRLIECGRISCLSFFPPFPLSRCSALRSAGRGPVRQRLRACSLTLRCRALPFLNSRFFKKNGADRDGAVPVDRRGWRAGVVRHVLWHWCVSSSRPRGKRKKEKKKGEREGKKAGRAVGHSTRMDTVLDTSARLTCSRHTAGLPNWCTWTPTYTGALRSSLILFSVIRVLGANDVANSFATSVGSGYACRP